MELPSLENCDRRICRTLPGTRSFPLLRDAWSILTVVCLVPMAFGAAECDFDIVVEPSVRTIVPGGFTTFSVWLPLKSGPPERLFVGCTQLFTGASISFDPQYVVTGGRSTVTLRTAPSVPTGTYTIVIQASRGRLARSTSVKVVITRQQIDLSVSATPRARRIQRGTSTEFSILVSSTYGTSSRVFLDVLGLPRGVTAWFSPGSVSAPGTSILKIAAGPWAKLGSHTITIRATCRGVSDYETVQLTIGAGDPGSVNCGTFRGVIDAYWETTIPEANTSEIWLIPEVRSGHYTIDLSLDLAEAGSEGEISISGWIVMRLEKPSRQILLEGYTARMSISPSMFSGQVVGRLYPGTGELELSWVDPPPAASTTFWDRYGDFEPTTYTGQEPWGRRLLDGLNPISYTVQLGGEVVSLFADHFREWEVDPPGGVYGTDTYRFSGKIYRTWSQLTQTGGQLRVTRSGRQLNYTSMLLQEADVISTSGETGARLATRGFEILLDRDTVVNLRRSSPPARTGPDIVAVARKEGREFSWKYWLNQPTRLPWVLDAAGNEEPIWWGVGRPKPEVFVASVLYKAGFCVPRHHLFDDPLRPQTSDPARPTELYDTSRYSDILQVVKRRDAPVVYSSIREGDLLVTPSQVVIVSTVYADSVDVIYYSTAQGTVVEERWKVTTWMVVRRPTARQEFSGTGHLPLTPLVQKGRIRMYNSTYELWNQTFAYLYCEEEIQLYTSEIELYTGKVELDEIQVTLEEISVTLQELPVYLEEMPVKLIETPMCTIEVQRSDVAVQVLADGTTVVEMLHGLGKVSTKQGSRFVYLYPGDRVTVTARGVSTPEKPGWTEISRWWQEEKISTGHIYVVPSPGDSEVYLDGLPMGLAPLDLEVSPGAHLLEVHSEGYEAWRDVANIAAGRSLIALPQLAPTGGRILSSNFIIFQDGTRLNVTIRSDCLVSRFGFSNETRSIMFLSSGKDGEAGRVEVEIPKELIPSPFVVLVDGEETKHDVVESEGYSSVLLELPQWGQRLVSIAVWEQDWAVFIITVIAIVMTLTVMQSGEIVRRAASPEDLRADRSSEVGLWSSPPDKISSSALFRGAGPLTNRSGKRR